MRNLIPLSSLSQASMQQIFLIPACLITLAHEKHGQRVVQSLHPTVLLIPTQMIADYSACRHRQVSSPLLQLLLHLLHPPLKHDSNPFGVPLYPVDTTRFYQLTITAPTEDFMQFDLLLAISASFIKYQSQLGRNLLITLASLSFILYYSCCILPLFIIFTLEYSRHSRYSSFWYASSIQANSCIVISSHPDNPIFQSNFACFLQAFLYLCANGASTHTTFMKFRCLRCFSALKFGFYIINTPLSWQLLQHKSVTPPCLLISIYTLLVCYYQDISSPSTQQYDPLTFLKNEDQFDLLLLLYEGTYYYYGNLGSFILRNPYFFVSIFCTVRFPEQGGPSITILHGCNQLSIPDSKSSHCILGNLKNQQFQRKNQQSIFLAFKNQTISQICQLLSFENQNMGRCYFSHLLQVFYPYY